MMKILSFLTFVSAVLTIYFDYQDKRFVYLFKPLTMIFIIALVWFYGNGRKGFYCWAILAGFAFSLVGDTLLINPQNFVFGLASFLVAHVCYIVAFFKAGEGKFKPVSLVAYPVGGAIFMLVSGGVPENLKIPVAVYSLAISTMLGAAINFYLTQKTPAARFALVGAAFFVLSDSLLAYNKFNGGFFLAAVLILSTYFFAQWLIARSV
ncbi:MAG: lysoplasmalogenase [Acidobacteriota bacterium]|nr:lysoplasmalogenase [Acidobacteriota bacterium]